MFEVGDIVFKPYHMMPPGNDFIYVPGIVLEVRRHDERWVATQSVYKILIKKRVAWFFENEIVSLEKYLENERAKIR